MIWALKEEKNKTLQEMQGNKNNWRKWINTLKEPRNGTNSWRKQIKLNFQELKMEIEAIKKTQTDKTLEMEKSR